MPSIRSVFVGQPKVMADARGEWTSSIARDRVFGPIEVTRCGLKGDRVTQPFHGSLDAAICCQPADHYRFWRDRHSMALEDGSVGENFTLAEVTDDEVCATDVVKAGTALLQVTGPRVPCATLARRIGRADWVKLTVKENRSGFYARVLEPGIVEEGDGWLLEERPNPGATITAINRCYFGPFNADFGRRLAQMEGIGNWWRQQFSEKVLGSEYSGSQMKLELD